MWKDEIQSFLGNILLQKFLIHNYFGRSMNIKNKNYDPYLPPENRRGKKKRRKLIYY